MAQIIGKKLGMTQVFDDKGNAIPVTVIQAGPCTVVQRKTQEKDGYLAVQVGFEELPEKRAKKILNKPEQGHFAKHGTAGFRHIEEFRVTDLESVGATITADAFEAGQLVDVIGTSKGKGFQSTMKRHRFSGGPASHGSKVHRRPCSNGSTDSGRTFKGKKRPGQMGNARVTAIGLRVIRVDAENNLLLVRGSVPGCNGRLVTVRRSNRKG